MTAGVFQPIPGTFADAARELPTVAGVAPT